MPISKIPQWLLLEMCILDTQKLFGERLYDAMFVTMNGNFPFLDDLPMLLRCDEEPHIASIAEEGFEPPTFWLWARRASRLLHSASCTAIAAERIELSSQGYEPWMVIQTTLPQVPQARFELARSYEHSGLNRARLPIPATAAYYDNCLLHARQIFLRRTLSRSVLSEGFEPSTLRVSDECSNQTELRQHSVGTPPRHFDGF